MIEFTSGNILEADAEALINTVNTAGVMGKGIALQFRQAFPENYEAYRKACERGEVQPGRMFVFATGRLSNPRWIINFPTKRHWKGKSRLEDIEAGLVALVQTLQTERIRSVAVPPLGCGNGGLDWNVVRPLIERALAALPDVRVLLFAPEGAPAAETMRVATDHPNMTPGRAVLVALLGRYLLAGYRLTRLEIQKLAYFLQAAGEPLRLLFVKHTYGPYAESLNHVLQRIEGHLIRGYGDRSGKDGGSAVRVLPEALEEAETFLRDRLEKRERLERVTELIDGFETPFGMELLATVHWAAKEAPDAATELEAVVQTVHAWSKRKRDTFQPDQIKVAWKRLKETGWL